MNKNKCSLFKVTNVIFLLVIFLLVGSIVSAIEENDSDIDYVLHDVKKDGKVIQTAEHLQDAVKDNGNMKKDAASTDAAMILAATQTPPVISDPFPLYNASDVGLNPTLQVKINDAEGDTFRWVIGYSTGSSWNLLDSGIATGSINLSVPGSAITKYNTTYWWRVSATDSAGSGRLSERVYNFTTRAGNYKPAISSPSPKNNSAEISINPALQANIKDTENNSVDWTIQLFNGTDWQILNSGTEADGNGTISGSASSLFYNTSYFWKATARDSLGSGELNEAIYNFTTRPSNYVPTITNIIPQNNSVDVELNPVLTANIKDSDGNSVNWTVQLFNNTGWQILNSGTKANGAVTVNASIITSYNTNYIWKVTTVDYSGTVVEQISSFTSRPQFFSPIIRNETPKNGEGAVALRPTLSVYAEDVYNNSMNITISIYNNNAWQVLQKYNNTQNGTYIANASMATGSYKNYLWRVRVDDTAGYSNEKTFNFTTRGLLVQKFRTNVGNSQATQILPLMGDVDNDGTNEIVMATGLSLVSVNGKTGAIEWSLPGSGTTAIELSDLNNDGVPEILQGIPGPYVRAVYGNGTIMWTSVRLRGEDQGLFPLVTYDIDGDGYPTIYFATEDRTPSPYSGNVDNYIGAISMLDNKGNLLRSTWIRHPCWGGLSLGDYNFDGVFELYLSDRKYGYDNSSQFGPQAFNAHTLEPIWQRPDLQHSSPMIILANVTGDENLEAIATPITLKGPIVMYAANASPIYDYSNLKLSTHGTGTVYDIDDDGNMEIIMGTSYPDNAPMDFVVFDLITGQTEFRPTFPYHTSWPPKLGDVTGDGKMDILAPMGNEFNYSNYPLLVYDNNYKLIDVVNISGAGQLTPALVADTDSDGLNEVVVAGVNGILLVYDTPAPTPNPAPRTWNQFYSEYRRGVAEYVEPPGPKAPLIRNESPLNNSQNLINPVLRVNTFDFQKDRMNIKFEINNGSGWQLIKTYENKTAGTYSAITNGYVKQDGSTYLWKVTAQDVKGNKNEKIFAFSTYDSPKNESPWGYRKQITINHTKVSANLANFPVLIQLHDYEMAGHVVQFNGNDIMFTAADGVTKLDHELEYYLTEDLVAWVSADLSSTTDTILYVYYGNADATPQENPEAVWDSNYLTVQHLEETSGAVLDSTSRNNDGTALYGVNQTATGKMDGGYGFDGVNGRVDLPQVFNTTQTQFTIEGWAYSGNKQGYIISQRGGSSSGVFVQYYPVEGNFQLYVNSRVLKMTASNAWHYVVASFDGVNAKLSVDGGTPVTGTATLTWPALVTSLGDRSTGGRTFSGRLDEIRLSNVARSDGYVLTSYNNQNNANTFFSVGVEERVGSNITSWTCNGVDKNDASVCNSHGTCTAQNVCSCTGGYTGNNCQIAPTWSCSGIDKNNASVCSSHGTCTAQDVCSCTGGYSGTNCEIPPTGNESSYRKRITIDHTKVSGNLAGFPVLIDINDASIADHAKADGSDIKFTSSDGNTKLNHEIENYAAGHLVAWVSADLSSASDTILYVYYGNGNATAQENPEAVWDSNYLAVHHLEENATVEDSTSNNKDGTALYGVNQTSTGKMDGGYGFDGVNDRVDLPQVFSAPTPFTIEGWAYSGNKQGYIISQRGGSSSGVFVQYYPVEGNFQLYVNSRILKVAASMNAWHYVVASFDGVNAKLSIDGGTPVTGSATLTWPALVTSLGDRNTGGRTFSGRLDEIRLSNVARSDAYVLTSYNNQNNANTFYSVGVEES